MVNIYSIYSVWSPAYFISFHGYVDIHFFREKHAIILSIFFLAVVCHFSFIYFELFFSVLCVFVCVCVCVWVCNPLSISLDEFRINYSSWIKQKTNRSQSKNWSLRSINKIEIDFVFFSFSHSLDLTKMIVFFSVEFFKIFWNFFFHYFDHWRPPPSILLDDLILYIHHNIQTKIILFKKKQKTERRKKENLIESDQIIIM